MSMKANKMPSLQELKHALHYNPETGVFTWDNPAASNKFYLVGKVAGAKVCSLTKPYIRINIDGQGYFAHRLAWLWMTGDDPGEMRIDHINGDRLDNRFENLRLATVTQNWANSKRMKNNTSGYKGVTFHKGCSKWMSRICAQGKRVTLGFFDSAEEAHAAYIKAANDVFGEYANAG